MSGKINQKLIFKGYSVIKEYISSIAKKMAWILHIILTTK